jgi:hypothetical protein
MRVLVALAAVVLVIAAAAAIGFAAHGEWLVSVLCGVAAVGAAVSLYLRITLLKSQPLARLRVIGDLVRSPPDFIRGWSRAGADQALGPSGT